MKVRIRLDTVKDINKFVEACSTVTEPVYVTDGNGLRVSAKAVLGVRYSMEFANIWCECDHDIYNEIAPFIIVD